MTSGSSVAVVRDIQTLFDTGTAGGLSDRQLLERFAARHDASSDVAFEVLVLRHGPMVLRVCRNVLRDRADAEDAFQATFLVLVRRRNSIQQLESVGGWLYGVACRVAARARVEAARRKGAEGRAALRVVEAVDPTDGDEAGLGPVVQEEVRRLPGKYRAVVALCYWEGMTQEQAAVQLGCPLGTVRSRLARARRLLHRRLTRRGLAPLAGVVASSFDSAMAGAGAVASRLWSVPHELVHSTIQAAARVAAGQATSQAVSGVVASLIQQVVWSMTMIKISSVMVGVILVGLTGYGVGLAALRAGESRSVAREAPIDAIQAGQDGGLGRAQPGSRKPAARKPEAKTAGREKIYANVAGQTTIVYIVPDGSTVKKGQLVCELDSASLKDQLINQRITTESAKANSLNATLTREEGELAVVEYESGIYVFNLAEIEGDIKIAEAELALAQEELNTAKASTTDKLAIKRLELAVFRAQFGLEKGQNRKKLLVDFTKPRTIKQLKSDVQKAHSTELAKKATWELETGKEKKLERQIAACEIKAPRDGTLVYFPGRTQVVLRKDGTTAEIPLIEEGATVRERQILFEIIPMSD
ncbi:MAG: sigma-70 family RNA polymerase sigma factor [Isosphaerales bacterium]